MTVTYLISRLMVLFLRQAGKQDEGKQAELQANHAESERRTPERDESFYWGLHRHW